MLNQNIFCFGLTFSGVLCIEYRNIILINHHECAIRCIDVKKIQFHTSRHQDLSIFESDFWRFLAYSNRNVYVREREHYFILDGICEPDGFFCPYISRYANDRKWAISYALPYQLPVSIPYLDSFKIIK